LLNEKVRTLQCCLYLPDSVDANNEHFSAVHTYQTV